MAGRTSYLRLLADHYRKVDAGAIGMLNALASGREDRRAGRTDHELPDDALHA